MAAKEEEVVEPSDGCAERSPASEPGAVEVCEMVLSWRLIRRLSSLGEELREREARKEDREAMAMAVTNGQGNIREGGKEGRGIGGMGKVARNELQQTRWVGLQTAGLAQGMGRAKILALKYTLPF